MKIAANIQILLGIGLIITGVFRYSITLGCILTGLALVAAGVGVLASQKAKSK